MKEAAVQQRQKLERQEFSCFSNSTTTTAFAETIDARNLNNPETQATANKLTKFAKAKERYEQENKAMERVEWEVLMEQTERRAKEWAERKTREKTERKTREQGKGNTKGLGEREVRQRVERKSRRWSNREVESETVG